MNYIRCFLVILTIYPPLVTADSFLCIADASAGVGLDDNGRIEASVYDHRNQKYLLTNQSGKWLLKEIGKDYALLDSCADEYFCERKDGYAGTFRRDNKGNFTIHWLTKLGNKVVDLVSKGRCSAL